MNYPIGRRDGKILSIQENFDVEGVINDIRINEIRDMPLRNINSE